MLVPPLENEKYVVLSEPSLLKGTPKEEVQLDPCSANRTEENWDTGVLERMEWCATEPVVESVPVASFDPRDSMVAMRRTKPPIIATYSSSSPLLSPSSPDSEDRGSEDTSYNAGPPGMGRWYLCESPCPSTSSLGDDASAYLPGL
jgi:hypothetical protein